MTPFQLIRLTPLMERTSGRPEIVIGLIGGPVVMHHPELASQHIREIAGNGSGTCNQAESAACMHGVFVAGILSAKRGSVAPAICPNCTLLVRPIFAETKATNGEMPSATPEELAEAIVDCLGAKARVLNVSGCYRPTCHQKRARSICIFSYTNRNTDFTEKFCVRCDITEEFPFLVTKLSPYYDR